MSEDRPRHPSPLFIALLALLLAAVIALAGEALRVAMSRPPLTVAAPAAGEPAARSLGAIAAREGILAPPAAALARKAALGGAAPQRTLADYYARRAYPGAPPHVPHASGSDMDPQAPGCLSCHERGGYVPELRAFTPITPHPEFASCRQCHVPRQAEGQFAAQDWAAPEPPRLGARALPGAPPAIPHALRLRERCLACHGGAAAVREIATTHPERQSCQQCHVTVAADREWRRALAAGKAR